MFECCIFASGTLPRTEILYIESGALPSLQFMQRH